MHIYLFFPNYTQGNCILMLIISLYCDKKHKLKIRSSVRICYGEIYGLLKNILYIV